MRLVMGSKQSKVHPGLAVIAVLVLALCASFPINFALWFFDSGFTINSNWSVIEVTLCEDHPDLCPEGEAPLMIGDQIVQLGDFDNEDFEHNRIINPFEETDPGDTISITFERDGETHQIQYRIPPANPYSRLISLVAPLFLIIPFWVAGSAVLLFMRPRTVQWLLLVLAFYLMAVWLATGTYSNFRVLYSSLLLHAISWLMMPVFIHLHLVVPSSLVGPRVQYLLWALYGIGIVMAILELFLIPDQYVYLISMVVLVLGSGGVLIWRVFGRRSAPADKIASRIMLAGIGIAFFPGFIIWMMPTLLAIDPPSVVATSISMLAIPLLPLFYTYAVYKRRLGRLEFRLNQIIAVYALFIIYLLLLSVALYFRSALPASSNQVFAFYLVLILAIGLAVFPLNERFGRAINRLAYGSDIDPDDLYRIYASEIPASTDRERLVQILTEEILPPLLIRQSALLVKDAIGYSPIYRQHVDQEDFVLDNHAVEAVTLVSGVYRPPAIEDEKDHDVVPDWIRLSINLERRSETLGLWMFGHRDPDDYYSRKDIDLLNNLASQVAVAVDNLLLLEEVQSELQERKRAEEALQHYSERLRLIHEIDQAILEVGSSAEIAQEALAGLNRLIPFSRGSVVYYEPEHRESELLAVLGTYPNENLGQREMPIDREAIKARLESGQLWFVNDIRLIILPGKSPGIIDELELRAAMAAPLIVSGELIGALVLTSPKESGFTEEHKLIAGEVANSLAIALHSARLLETVQTHSDELQLLSTRLLNVQEEERKNLSHELHDEIGQVLTAITYNLAAIRQDIPASTSKQVDDRLSDTEELVLQVTDRIRDMSLQLRPSMLKDLGLVPTLRWYIKQYKRRVDKAVEFSASPDLCPLSEEVETALYRFVQEGLTNAARHAKAGRIAVTLFCEDGCVRAVVEDDGIGFSHSGSPYSLSDNGGIGLLGIRERLTSVGGILTVISAEGNGTILKAEVPIKALHEEDTDTGRG